MGEDARQEGTTGLRTQSRGVGERQAAQLDQREKEDDPGDVLGILTEDITDNFGKDGQPLRR